MATYTVPAIMGRMGSNRYYQAVMRADELAATVGVALDFKEFDNFMASERMQRAMSEIRVEKEIVPYLTKSADRFFGSIIVLVYKPDQFVFEPLEELTGSALKGVAKRFGSSVGALTITGGKMFALDGQHRLHALRTVISESIAPRSGMPIVGPFKDVVKDDELSVIFVEYSTTEKARRIFNKVNRYAKPTSRSTNLLTTEDDGYAIIARCLAGLDDPSKFDSDIRSPIPLTYPNGKKVMEVDALSLNASDSALLTIDTVNHSVERICKATSQPELAESTTIVRPTDDILRVAYEECARWWDELLTNLKPLSRALQNSTTVIDARIDWAEGSLVYRPFGQKAVISGLMEAHQRSQASPAVLVRRLNQVPMSLGHELWRGILAGGHGERRRMIGSQIPLASDLVTFLLLGADGYGARDTEVLQTRFIEAKREYGIDKRKLPPAVV